MALFNYATKEITLKIVYYGPGLSGKTTNIEHLHSSLDQTRKGKLLSLSTEADRTLFFDFLPVEVGKIKDFSIRFQLYTVPGQVRYNATRRLVLKGADAVVFVADSQKDMREPNIESFENMRENLLANDLNPDDIPVVLQYNKRDLPNILTTDELNKDLNARGFTFYETVAIKGLGVEETFQTITKQLLKHIAKKHRIDIQTKDVPREKPKAAPVHELPEIAKALPVEELHAEMVDTAYPDIEPEKVGLTSYESSSDFVEKTEEIEVEQIRGLQDYDELMEVSARESFSGEEPVSQNPANPDEPSDLEKMTAEPEGFTFQDNSIESIYQAFMSEEKQGIPAASEKDIETFEPTQQSRESDLDLGSLKSFKESLKSPLREEPKPAKHPPLPKRDFFESMKPAGEDKNETASAKVEEKKPPIREAAAPAPKIPPAKPPVKKKDPFESAVQSSSSDTVFTGSENIILDEINSLARTMRKINDSITSLKAEMNILATKMDDMEKKFSTLNVRSEELFESVKGGNKGLHSDEIVHTINNLKQTIEKAKKKKLWILFS